MPFIERQITITITLQARQGAPSKGVAEDANPTFKDASGADTGKNTVTINGGGTAAQNGLRISARVTRPGLPSASTAEVQIYNLSANIANQISTLGVPLVYMVGANLITIAAGDVGSPPTTIFTGTIYNAWRDLKNPPESIFNISAQWGSLYGSAPAKPLSINGSSPISTILGNVAPLAGLKLVSLFGSGQEPVISDLCLSGTVRDQIRKLVQIAGIDCNIDDVSNTLIIGPKNSSLSLEGQPIPVIGPPPIGNMVGYPAYTAQGLKVVTEFSTDIRYRSKVQIKGSSIPVANGEWVVYYMDYDLECQTENGPWYTNLEMANPNYPVLAQPS